MGRCGDAEAQGWGDGVTRARMFFPFPSSRSSLSPFTFIRFSFHLFPQSVSED